MYMSLCMSTRHFDTSYQRESELFLGPRRAAILFSSSPTRIADPSGIRENVA